ncbi:hypothetical protein [Spirosoma aerophilum]
MSRPTFLLIAGIYSALLAFSMVFTPEMALKNYGVPRVDVSHISIMQFLGINIGSFAILLFLNRNTPTSYTLRTLLLAEAVNVLAGIILGIYHVYGLNVPFSAFFVGDTIFRFVLGIGFLYFYNQKPDRSW